MISADTTFNQIFEAINPILLQKGFSIVKAKSHPEAFGSRYITFGNDKEFIRLIWDGRDSWFVLESVLVESAEEFGGWKDILIHPFDLKNDNDEVTAKIANDIKVALSDYLEKRIS